GHGALVTASPYGGRNKLPSAQFGMDGGNPRAKPGGRGAAAGRGGGTGGPGGPGGRGGPGAHVGLAAPPLAPARGEPIPCPFCGGHASALLPFCPQCGRRLTAPGSGPSCARCGSTVPAGTRFCATCGAPLVEAQPRRSPAVTPRAGAPLVP